MSQFSIAKTRLGRLAAVALLAAAAPPAVACDCRGLPKVSPAIMEEAEYIFSGVITSITERQCSSTTRHRDGSGEIKSEYLPRYVDFEVTAAWKGVDHGEFRLASTLSDCSFPFQLGGTYLVFALQAEGTLPETSICTRTREVSEADDLLRALGKPQWTPELEEEATACNPSLERPAGAAAQLKPRYAAPTLCRTNGALKLQGST